MPRPATRLVAILLFGLVFAAAASLTAALWLGLEPGDLLAGLGLRKPPPEGVDPRAPIDPARRYHLVVWDYRLPLRSPSGAPFDEATRAAIRRFEARYPNVTVDLVLLDPATGPARMAQALTAGYPPDVYCSPYGPPALGSALQVPIGLYLDYETWARYHPVAWQAVKVHGTVWAWPRWMMFWPWLANADLLEQAGLDPARVATEGWTRDEFAAAAAALSDAENRWEAAPALAAPVPAVVLRDLVFLAHLSGETPAPPADFWSGPAVADAAAWLTALERAGALMVDPSTHNPGILDSFAHGRTAVLVNPSPWATGFLRELVPRPDPWQFAVPSRDHRPPMILVTPPHEAGQLPVTWVSAACVTVFRQARYRGDDNTRLAVELAREISVGARVWLRNEVLVAPASFDELASWRVRLADLGPATDLALKVLDRLAELPPDRLSLALSAVSYGPLVPRAGEQGLAAEGRATVLGGAPFRPRGYLGPALQDVLAPIAARLWEGDIGPAELVNEVSRALSGEP